MNGFRFAIVVSRFNEEITEGLLRGAQEFLAEASVPAEAIKIFRVPGAFEIPLAAKRLGESGDFHRHSDGLRCADDDDGGAGGGAIEAGSGEQGERGGVGRAGHGKVVS